MSKLNELKLKDVEDLSGINPMSSNADGGGGSAIDGGEKDEVVITGKKGSGSGSVNSAATCHKCGRPYNDYGLCPVCDSGSTSGSGSWFEFGSGYVPDWDVVNPTVIKAVACQGKNVGDKCHANFGEYLGYSDGTCRQTGGRYLECILPPKIEACIGEKENAPCSFLYNGSTSHGLCRYVFPNKMRYCSELN